jgi:hypothetical protein
MPDAGLDDRPPQDVVAVTHTALLPVEKMFSRMEKPCMDFPFEATVAAVVVYCSTCDTFT